IMSLAFSIRANPSPLSPRASAGPDFGGSDSFAMAAAAPAEVERIPAAGVSGGREGLVMVGSREVNASYNPFPSGKLQKDTIQWLGHKHFSNQPVNFRSRVRVERNLDARN